MLGDVRFVVEGDVVVGTGVVAVVGERSVVVDEAVASFAATVADVS